MRHQKKWTDDRMREEFKRAHQRWLTDPAYGKPRGRPFSGGYLRRLGMGRALRSLYEGERLAAFVAACSPAVRADWKTPPRHWRDPHILPELERYFARWLAEGQPARMRWNRQFIKRCGGSGFVHSLDTPPTRAEFFLRKLGGAIEISWSGSPRSWNPADARERVREAHTRWQRDDRFGKPAGRKFNTHYLKHHGFSALLEILRTHVRGGVRRFVQQTPDLAADWSGQKCRTMAGARRELRAAYRCWRRDIRRRGTRRPFDVEYLRLTNRSALVNFLRKRRLVRVFAARSLAPVRRAWNAPVPDTVPPTPSPKSTTLQELHHA